MTDPSRAPQADYHGRLDAAIGRVGDMLLWRSIPEATELANVEAVHLHHDAPYLLGNAAFLLANKKDATAQDAGFNYLTYDATLNPDLEMADGVTFDSRRSASDPETRRYSERMFEWALQNFRTVAQADDFVLNKRFIESFDLVTARIQEEGFDDMFADALLEFGPKLVEAAASYGEPADQDKRTVREHRDVKGTLDGLLVSYIDITDDRQLFAQALDARRAITDRLSKEVLAQIDIDKAITDTLLSERYEDAILLLINNDEQSLSSFWAELTAIVTENNPESDVQARAAISAIVSAEPDYFSPSYSHWHLTRDLGTVVGALDLRDQVAQIVAKGETPEEAAYTTCAGIAQGLGYRHNSDGLAHLLNLINHYPPEILRAIQINYDEAVLANAQT